jgi:hypothetical protein
MHVRPNGLAGGRSVLVPGTSLSSSTAAGHARVRLRHAVHSRRAPAGSTLSQQGPTEDRESYPWSIMAVQPNIPILLGARNPHVTRTVRHANEPREPHKNGHEAEFNPYLGPSLGPYCFLNVSDRTF